MNNLKILCVMPYFERPNMVINALRSFSKIDYDNYEIAIVDDGSENYPIENILSNFEIKNLKIYKTNDSIENKINRGSIHGKFMNKAMKESDADIFLMISDDDAITTEYFKKLNEFYTTNPDVNWSYCHVIGYDPMSEIPCNTLSNFQNKSWTTKATTRLNWIKPINPFCKLDATQVSWRSSVSKENNLWLPEEQTKNLDASFYQIMYDKLGNCVFNNCVGVFKGFHSDQLTNRNGIEAFKPLDSQSKPKYVSICAMFKNEAPYLKEWIDYHLGIGVDHFYLYDDQSEDNWREILKPYFEKKLVTIKSIKSEDNKKKIVYEDFLKTHKNETFWCAFIDLDEFITIRKDNVFQVMKNYEKLPAVGANWLMMSGHDKETDKVMVSNYCNDPYDFTHNNVSLHIKSIVNPRKTIPIYTGPHHFLFNSILCFPEVPSTHDEDGAVISGKSTKVDGQPYYFAGSDSPKFNHIFVRHYWLKNEKQFTERRLNTKRDDNGKIRYKNIEQVKEEYKLYDKLYRKLNYEEFLTNLGENNE